MTVLPVAKWHASLEDMEAALGNTLAALDRYQEGWERVLAEQAAPADARPSVDALEVRLREWDARLIAAAELAASVERELNDRQLAVGRWHESVTEWRGGLR